VANPDPFDILGQYDDDEEDENERRGASPDPFDVLDRYDDYSDETPGNGQEAPAQADQPWWGSLANGLTLNRADDLADLAGNAAEYLGADSFGADLHGAANGIRGAQKQHPYLNTAGRLATGVAGSMAAGPGMLAQAGAGALMGATESGDAQGTAMGAGGGLLGGLLGKGLGKVTDVVAERAPNVARALAPGWMNRAENAVNAARGRPSVPRGARPAPTQAPAFGPEEYQPPGSSDWFPVEQPAPAPSSGRVGQRLGNLMGEGLDRAANAFTPSKPAEKAEGTQPTMNWAIQGALGEGASGLPPEDAEALNEALMSGDTAAVNALSYSLQQRHPAYARAVSQRLAKLND
jgi:hypothetical protein